MTELQWLIQILTKQKLSSAMKDLFIERIGEVETNLVPKAHMSASSSITAQAPSTQRLLDEPKHSPISVPPAQRIIGGEVSTGNGTKGPRKF